MKIRRTKPTMKQQLFLFFMLAAVLVCLIFSAYYFVSEQRVLRNNLERENTKNLQYAIEKIEENAMRVEKFANQICQNGQIRALMLADDPFAPAETMAVASMYSTHENVAYNMKKVPIWEKYALSLSEAAEYFHIGTRRLRQIIAKDKYAKYLIWNGGRVFFKRKMFEEYLNNEVQLFSNNNTES